MFGQEARRLGSLIKLLSALQSVHGCGGGSANNYCDVEKSLISRNLYLSATKKSTSAQNKLLY